MSYDEILHLTLTE